MTVPSPSEVNAILATIVDPYLGQDILSAKCVRDLGITPEQITLKLRFPYPALRRISELKQMLTTAFARWPQALSLEVDWKIRHHVVQKGLKPKSVIKNIIAVASGKGGVGKSTVAANLAVALQAMGAKVALLDADIYGPSQPHMLGKDKMHAYTYQKKLLPVESFGVQSISIGYLVDAQSPMIWRGPMVSSALQQLLNETAWEECDYMIIDLPPGTGDIQLTLAQKIPLSGVVIVTTPQDIALLDAKKAYKMFEKVEVGILGVVENMSTHQCSQCGHHEAIFGTGGGRNMAQEFNIPLLGEIPLSSVIREQADAGTPFVIASPESASAKAYWEMAHRVAGALAQREIDYTAAMPKITMETN